MATLTVRPAAGANSPVDGYVARGSTNQTLADIRADAGTAAVPTQTSALVALQSSVTTNQYSDLARGILCFDTSSIPDDAIITSATMRLRGIFKLNGLGEPDLHITSASPNSTANLISSDYGTLGTTSFGSISYASFSDAAYNDIALNANGLAHINKSGVTSFGVRTSWDLTGIFTGVWSSSAATQMWWSTADETGTSQDPELVIEYEVPTTTSTSSSTSTSTSTSTTSTSTSVSTSTSSTSTSTSTSSSTSISASSTSVSVSTSSTSVSTSTSQSTSTSFSTSTSTSSTSSSTSTTTTVMDHRVMPHVTIRPEVPSAGVALRRPVGGTENRRPVGGTTRRRFYAK